MSGYATIELRTAMANCYFKRTLPIHNQITIAVCTRVPAVNAAANQLFEPDEAEYARRSVLMNDANWSTAPDGSVFLDTEVVFPTPVTSWGWIPGWAMLATHSSIVYTPRVLATGRLLKPVKVTVGKPLRLPPGTLGFLLQDSA